mgnify:FL=1
MYCIFTSPYIMLLFLYGANINNNVDHCSGMSHFMVMKFVAVLAEGTGPTFFEKHAKLHAQHFRVTLTGEIT